jgi:hypothetical protein
MCMVVYVGSDYPLPEIPMDGTGNFHVAAVPAPDPVRRHFTKPCVVYAGAHGGCGCGFQYGEHEDSEPYPGNVDSRRRLAEYVAVALQHQPEVELYACWSADEGEPAEYHDRIRPADLTTTRTYFRERELLVVTAE